MNGVDELFWNDWVNAEPVSNSYAIGASSMAETVLGS